MSRSSDHRHSQRRLHAATFPAKPAREAGLSVLILRDVSSCSCRLEAQPCTPSPPRHWHRHTAFFRFRCSGERDTHLNLLSTAFPREQVHSFPCVVPADAPLALGGHSVPQVAELTKALCWQSAFEKSLGTEPAAALLKQKVTSLPSQNLWVAVKSLVSCEYDGKPFTLASHTSQ